MCPGWGRINVALSQVKHTMRLMLKTSHMKREFKREPSLREYRVISGNTNWKSVNITFNINGTMVNQTLDLTLYIFITEFE